MYKIEVYTFVNEVHIQINKKRNFSEQNLCFEETVYYGNFYRCSVFKVIKISESSDSDLDWLVLMLMSFLTNKAEVIFS